MRVGLLCPYSLSIPGGVQGQVLGLARTLRSRGHEARVLGPCDGPPPAPFVTPLGKSVPAAANGSVAPLAPDPAAQLRTMRALWDEDFLDVLHLHEPFAPGPCMTPLVIKPAPTIGTFHAAGEIRLQAHGRRHPFPHTDGWICGVRCPRTAANWPRARRRGSSPSSSTGWSSTATASASRGRPTGRRSSAAGATSPARASRCCSRPWPACPATFGSGSAATGQDRLIDRAALEREITTLERDQADANASPSLQESQQATLTMLRQRLANHIERGTTLREIQSDLKRVEAQVDLALDDATMRGTPTAVSAKVELASRMLDPSLFELSSTSNSEMEPPRTDLEPER